jgi:hypothetical protein
MPLLAGTLQSVLVGHLRIIHSSICVKMRLYFEYLCGICEGAMRRVFQPNGRPGIADSGAQAVLQRYQSERNAAAAWIRQIQTDGVATKEDWLEFSKRICGAGERCLNAAFQQAES